LEIRRGEAKREVKGFGIVVVVVVVIE